MNKRKLRNLEVSPIGFGAMGFSHGYGETPSEEEAIKLIREAYNIGYTMFDTAEGYGNGKNEILLGKALKPFRKNVILASKFYVSNEEYNSFEDLENNIRTHLSKTLKRLNTNYLDIYYQHRINKDIPVENIAKIMGKLIDEGKIKGWGQSQSTASEIRQAHKITPLTAVQSEYSIMERQCEAEVIPTLKELGIGFVPFSPLASGFLSGTVQSTDNYEGDDVRKVISRFEKENIEKNQTLIDLLNKFAEQKQSTPSQISLAWILHKEDFIVPIPGSRNIKRIKENYDSSKILLTDNEFKQIENELNKITIYGNRTDEDIAKLSESKEN